MSAADTAHPRHSDDVRRDIRLDVRHCGATTDVPNFFFFKFYIYGSFNFPRIIVEILIPYIV